MLAATTKPANHTIVVYGFLNADGVEEDFETLDEAVARSYATANDLDIIERVYEYSFTRSAVDSFINVNLGD